ncbi:ABC transporter permease subunit [Rhodoplanes sp. TEM]|uniref:ABC transporter permease subunit n=1 Tax=Rhodoplanes tepidamans TaxID=200616 RepID=A0ABT5JBX8_RHOTP|nr:MULTISPECIES: ABC transporter permease subunit [Rhodoplanes]MDC7786769.1 ABC transporter permease subunit [Rhodoplanes tepidamans]MDC7983775.1 ABC transporter permease subunit [Rhodoplanes sp. TEM]MDQ0358208.1 NitT/TauT family transport system permease protein [Rhodoplanes tepidamans]
MTEIDPSPRTGAAAVLEVADVPTAPAVAAGEAAGGGLLDRSWPWQLASFVLVLGAWEIAGRWPVSLAFPPFSQVMTAMAEMVAAGDFVRAYAVTLPPLVVGVGIVGVLGVVLGIAMGLSRGFEWIGLPLMVVLQTAPIAAIIPLLTYFYGVSATSKIASVILLSAPIVVLNSYRGIRNTNASLLDMCRSFLGTRLQQVTKIMLPHASGMIFAGLRLGISAGFIGVVLAELLISPTGIGDLISYNRSIARYDKMFAAILSILALATVTLSLLQRLENRLFRPDHAVS